MAVQTKQQQLKEIEYQTKMLNNLKKWIRNLIILSSVGLVIAYWALKLQEGIAYNVIGVISIIFIVICVVLCVVIGLALKNGKANVDKIIQLVQTKS